MSTTSIKQVAQHAGVSVGTVSNVLNRPEVVAATTRQKVQAAIRELGFVRNESARALRSGRSRTVGLVVLDVANPFFTDVARGAEAVADEQGSVVSLCNSGDDPERERRHLERLEEQRVQGLLVTPVDATSPRLDQLVERGMRVVLVDRGPAGDDRCSVAVDDVEGGRLAATHLAEQGHRRIAFVGGPAGIRQVADRLEGATKAAADADVALRVLETPSLTVTAGRAAGERIAELPASQRPTGVTCANDLLALGVLQEMTRRGLRVPQDVAIVGYDDIDYAAAAAVPLSSVRQPRDLLGRTAAELLFEEINDPEAHEHRQVVFEPELAVRESSIHRRRRRSNG
ncbi:LacI family DNA-binding transcriptional regulator [Motilibacter aurantiacus]|uniref:LacI family DNA-binding transcriptional regulator n=1 Tax=Motilibacter aurantiacus TaxID=2714955 RepID=UPI0014089F9E|nr:LacI family DNA-binding transcriptional regulator [Motilibacter aurantiacus]NHC47246.1 LacI family transcriptional regulator [Motilibacter aurantiacus]